MVTFSSRRRVAAGATVLSVLACGSAGGQAFAASPAGDNSTLTVVAVGPTASPPSRRANVEIAVDNSYDQLLCAPFTITLTWWRAGGHRYSASRELSNKSVASAGVLHIPAAAMRQGVVRYVATATQQCGLLAPTTTYAGRWPSSGSATVTVL